MAKKKKHTGPVVRFTLACRQGMHVGEHVFDDPESRTGKSVEMLTVSQFQLYRVAVPQPSSGTVTEQVECEGCGRRIKIEVASPTVIALRRYGGAVSAAVLGLLVTLLFLFIPDMREASASILGNGVFLALIALGGTVLLGAVLGLKGWLDRDGIKHAARTGDIKHRVLPLNVEEE